MAVKAQVIGTLHHTSRNIYDILTPAVIIQNLAASNLSLHIHIFTFPNTSTVCQKYFAVQRIFHSLLSVWKYSQTQSFVFDIVHEKFDEHLKEVLKPYNNHSVGEIYI